MTSTTLYSALSSLSPISEDSIPAGTTSLPLFLQSQFEHASLIADSIPVSSAACRHQIKTTSGPPIDLAAYEKEILSLTSRFANNINVSTKNGAAAAARPADLSSLWSSINLRKGENPLGINVYKLKPDDGKGSWFARRSVHIGVSFDEMRSGLLHETRLNRDKTEDGLPIATTDKPSIKKGVRGIGYERRFEKRHVKDTGAVEVLYQTAQFPGPLSPRDFCSLVLYSDINHAKPNTPREFVLVSRPVSKHPCLPLSRNGFVRGQLQSIELIREIVVPGSQIPTTEWIMIGRNDPAGNIPKWMMEKGTPVSIVEDVGVFLKWIAEREKTEGDGEVSDDEQEREEKLVVDRVLEKNGGVEEKIVAVHILA